MSWLMAKITEKRLAGMLALLVLVAGALALAGVVPVGFLIGLLIGAALVGALRWVMWRGGASSESPEPS